jgi:hypothetical protein
MGQSFRVALGAAVSIVAFASAAYALNNPPSQVGRLAFTEGTVSFHDDQQAGWAPAVINTPLTTGDSVWTEPNARSEISVAGTRVRMDGSTQLNMLSVNDSQTLLQIGQGRIDIKAYSLNPNMPYQVVTPRGTISLRQQGDYYVEAGSTQDATRLGVRSGAAQIQSLNGQTLTVSPGQVGEIYGEAGTSQLRTINTAPPAQPAYWATRDRQINYDLPTQYLSSGITGYEDLNAYGSWSNDSQYGNVWTPRSVPSGWQPYKTGHWSYVKPWGWTWVDEQPWGYAPYHYGRWANSGNRWVWVPPQREARPVYAPALVAFIGGLELAQALLGGNTSLGNQNSAPVGWFPLGPREAYVPSYSTDRAYYSRLNNSNQIQEQVLEDRWQLAQRREAYVAGQNSVLANQRFATVVPAEVFVSSQPVARAALQLSAAQIAAAPVAPVSAPPAPTALIVTLPPASAPAAKTADPAVPAAKTPAPAPADPKVEADAKARADAQAKFGANADLPVAKTTVADMPTLAKPATTATPTAPGPKFATAPNTPAAATNATGTAAPSTQGKATAPPLVPRTGAAPPELKDDKAPATRAPGTPEATAPAVNDNKMPTAPNAGAPAPTKPYTTAKPAAPGPAKPAEPPKVTTPPEAQPAQPVPRPAETRQSPPNDNKLPDKGAVMTPQRPAPAAEPPKPPAAPAELKQTAPHVRPAPAAQPTAPPPLVATPAPQPQQHATPALAPIAPPQAVPPPATPPQAAAPKSILTPQPPTPKAASAAAEHEAQKAHPAPTPAAPALMDEEKKNEKK